MKLIRLLVVASVFAVVGVGEVVAGEINNPVITIKPVQNRDGSFDSVWTGTAFFDPLPEYMKETRLTVKCVSRIDRDEDVVFWCNHPSNVQQLLELEPSKVQVPGPFRAGDTITAEFLIKPLRVGVYNFGIVASTVPPSGDRRMSRGVGSADANFVIGPDGTVTMMQAATIDFRYASDLGPMPDVFEERGAIYFIDPPPDFDRIDSVAKAHFESRVLRSFHGVVGVTSSTDRANTLDVKMAITPYRDFPGGIGIPVKHSPDIEVSNLTPSVPGPLLKGQKYEFSFSVTYSGEGVRSVSLGAVTRNPDLGNSDGPFAKVRSREVGNGLSLSLGLDREGHLLFITDHWPGGSLESLTLVSPESIDFRYGLLPSLKRASSTETTRSPGFEEALATDEVKQEMKREPRPRHERPKPPPRQWGP